LRHIAACNPPIDEPFLPWSIEGETVGWLRPQAADTLQRFPTVFEFDRDATGIKAVLLRPEIRGYELRSAALGEVVYELASLGVLTAVLGEPYPATPAGRESALCVVDRCAAGFFGLRSFGQHLNGFVRREDGLHMWLGRRAHDRLLFPGALDNMVAGGLPQHIGLHENLVKECAEEAGIPATLAAQAMPVGVVTYNRVADRGFRRDVLYCYDLEVPPEFEPRNTDGEVESFMLLPLDEVARLVSETDEFKLNCNLVVIDFLIRHGWLAPTSSSYLPLALGLRQPLAESPRHSPHPL
jgi:8-oxo-dGTP pyrophosphatase MutT (NUDIX family)